MLGSREVLHGDSVGAKEGPTMAGSAGRGEGLSSQTAEDAEDRYTSVIEAVPVGMSLGEEGKMDVWSPVGRTESLGGVGAKDRADSVKTGVEQKVGATDREGVPAGRTSRVGSEPAGTSVGTADSRGRNENPNSEVVSAKAEVK